MMSVKKDDKRNTNIGGAKYKTNDFEILRGLLSRVRSAFSFRKDKLYWGLY